MIAEGGDRHADLDHHADVNQRVINRVFGVGLTLAGALSLGRLDTEVADRLRDAIDQLDAVVRELQHAALDFEIQERDARAVGTIFYAVGTDLPICYEDHGYEPPPDATRDIRR